MRARLACLFFCLLPAPLAVAQQAPAPAYPGRPITIVVGFSAGGSTDIVARLVGEEFTSLNEFVGKLKEQQYQFATIPSVIQYVRGGRLRAIAVTSLARSASAPDVPTVAESGYPEFEASSWFGLLGPRDLPRDIVDKLHGELARIVKVPEIRERLIQQGADPVGSTPDEFAAYIRAETQKWARVVNISGARPE